MREHKARELSTTQAITLGFLTAILIGTFLLMLPAASASGTWTNPVDALFTATASVCVVGLTVVETCSHWSIFGQMIILLLIQVGGLGIVALTTAFMLLLGKKVTLKDRLLLEDAFNLNTLSGLVRFTKKILKGTLVVEAVGTVCFCLVFIPRFGIGKGIFVSIFHAVSAFCNAGMDIIGSNSLQDYITHPWMNFITMLLIVLGSIGFLVWWDVLRVGEMWHKKEITLKQYFAKLKLHSKLVLVTTFLLLFFGAVVVLILEYNNQETIGQLTFFEKIQASVFQSITLRTAGFTMIPQENLQDSTALLCMLFMFIGGSPVGTAGGVKTTTMAIIVMGAISIARGKRQTTIFKRTIPQDVVRRAQAIITISFIAVFVAILVLLALEQGSFLDVAYETVGAIGSTGLSRGITLSMNTAGRMVIMLCMFLGRIGPITMMIAFRFKGKGKEKLLEYPEEDVTVG